MAADPAPARTTDVYPLVAEQPDHVRVMVSCSCGGLTDLTYLAGMRPASTACAGCGEELDLPEAGSNG